MIPLEHLALDWLSQISMRIASAGKRFRNHMLWERERDPDFKLTERQALYLWFLVDMYRRQIKDAELLRWAAHRRLTAELPPIYLEGDLREPVQKKSKAQHPAHREVRTLDPNPFVLPPIAEQRVLFS